MAGAYVYRLFDAEDRLLYVGSTKCVEQRLGAHRCTQPWFGDVVRTEVEEFPSREAAFEGELAAIWQEVPLHNRRGIPPEIGAQRLKLRDAERKRIWDLRHRASLEKLFADAAEIPGSMAQKLHSRNQKLHGEFAVN